MINPERIHRVIGRTAAKAAAAVTPEGVVVDMKDGQAPIVVPPDLVKHLTGKAMPKVAMRCKRVDRNKAARRKQAKASRKRNR